MCAGENCGISVHVGLLYSYNGLYFLGESINQYNCSGHFRLLLS